MMRGELRDKVARSVAWSIAEKAGSALLQLAVSVVLLRHLMTDATDAWAILTGVLAVSLIVVDSGFSQALIRKADPAPGDYKSVFVFNIAVSLVLYALLIGIAPFIARFYNMPLVWEVAPVLFLLLPVNALCVIQNTIFTRQMRFALMSKVVFASSFAGGVIAIGMAVAGFGLWSFVAQRVTSMAVRAGLLWWLSDWRPRASFTPGALRQMAPFSLRLMATDLITTFYNKVPQFFFGSLYPQGMLGYFDQALKIRDQPLTSAVQSVQNVTYPALSKIGDDAPKFAESYRQVVMVTAYALFPAMVGLIAVAGELFPVLIGERWLPVVPYFRVVCLTGLFYPIAMIALNVLKVRSNGRIIVRLEVVKKVVMTVILAVTIFHSITAVTWGLVAMSIVEMVLNVGAARRYTTLTIRQLAWTLLPMVLLTAAMYAATWGVEQFITTPLLCLIVKIIAGAVVYIALSALFRLEAFREVTSMLRRQFRRE